MKRELDEKNKCVVWYYNIVIFIGNWELLFIVFYIFFLGIGLCGIFLLDIFDLLFFNLVLVMFNKEILFFYVEIYLLDIIICSYLGYVMNIELYK